MNILEINWELMQNRRMFWIPLYILRCLIIYCCVHVVKHEYIDKASIHLHMILCLADMEK